jgi:hypothetical protein
VRRLYAQSYWQLYNDYLNLERARILNSQTSQEDDGYRLLLPPSFMEGVAEDKGMKQEMFDASKMQWSLREVIAVQPGRDQQFVFCPRR